MDKDKLITFLTSNDEEIRKIGLNILLENYKIPKFLYTRNIGIPGKNEFSLYEDNNHIYKEFTTYLIKDIVRFFIPVIGDDLRIRELVNIIIEYNNEYRQNKRITAI